MTVAEALRVLGLPSSSTLEQIKSAWRRRVRETHPDTGGDAAMFRAVQDAYETLTTHPPEPIVFATWSSSTSWPACPTCRGTGSVSRGVFVTVCPQCSGGPSRCTACGGRGRITIHRGFMTLEINCLECRK